MELISSVKVFRANGLPIEIHEVANGDVGINLSHVDPVVQRRGVSVVAKVVGELWAGASQLSTRV